ncbi:MAG: hypothetical protein P2975_05200, partial [Gemmatimonadota bacterium]|nr:hypothetical protein [Gemmatimonadota bacterium]
MSQSASRDPGAPAFAVVHTGQPGAPAPKTPRSLPHRGGEANPTLEALRTRFGGAIGRHEVVWGDTTVYIARERVAEIAQWLHD